MSQTNDNISNNWLQSGLLISPEPGQRECLRGRKVLINFKREGGDLENCWNRPIGYTICASQMDSHMPSQRSWHKCRQAWKSSVGADGQFSIQAEKEPPGHGSGDGDGEGDGEGDGDGEGEGGCGEGGATCQHSSHDRPSSWRH